MDTRPHADPDLGAFHEMGRAAMDALPDPFRDGARDVVLRVADVPPGWMLREMGIADPLDLTGLYSGIPVTEKSVFDQPQEPDIVWLFRLPILAEWRARGDVDLDALVAHVVVHEIAHHFGWSDADIATIDRWWE